MSVGSVKGPWGPRLRKETGKIVLVGGDDDGGGAGCGGDVDGIRSAGSRDCSSFKNCEPQCRVGAVRGRPLLRLVCHGSYDKWRKQRYKKKEREDCHAGLHPPVQHAILFPCIEQNLTVIALCPQPSSYKITGSESIQLTIHLDLLYNCFRKNFGENFYYIIALRVRTLHALRPWTRRPLGTFRSLTKKSRVIPRLGARHKSFGAEEGAQGASGDGGSWYG